MSLAGASVYAALATRCAELCPSCERCCQASSRPPHGPEAAAPTAPAARRLGRVTPVDRLPTRGPLGPGCAPARTRARRGGQTVPKTRGSAGADRSPTKAAWRTTHLHSTRSNLVHCTQRSECIRLTHRLAGTRHGRTGLVPDIASTSRTGRGKGTHYSWRSEGRVKVFARLNASRLCPATS